MVKGQAPRGTPYRKAYTLLVIFTFVVTGSLIRGLLSEVRNSDELISAGDYPNTKQDDLAGYKPLPDKEANDEDTQKPEPGLNNTSDTPYDENTIIDDDKHITNDSEASDDNGGNKDNDASDIIIDDDIAEENNKSDIPKGITAASVYEKPEDKQFPYTIVTAVSDNHFCPLTAWVYHMYEVRTQLEEHQRPRLLIYDLGLLPFQQEILGILFERGYIDEIRVFDYGLYPNYFNVNVSRGEYAWKPVIVAEIARDYPGIIFWLDSGTFITSIFLAGLKSKLNQHEGFLSPTSPGSLIRWTHPGVFEYYNLEKSNYKGISNCNGAVILFDTNIVQNIIDEWEKCALVKDCIAPPGSSRDNHRQDQAILTLVAANHKYYCTDSKKTFKFGIHQDVHCMTNIENFERKHPLGWKPTEEIEEYIADYIKNFFKLHPDTERCFNPWTDVACPDPTIEV